MAGLTGTGKSTIAQELARRWNLLYISSDITRKALAGIAPGGHEYAPFEESIYSPELSRHTYDAILQQAEQHLQKGYSVVLDATFRRAAERARAVAVAHRAGVDVWLVECCLPEAEVQRRLERRFQNADSMSDGRWELFRQLQQQWEPVAEVPANRYLRSDTSGPPQKTLRQLLYQLYASM